MDSSVSDIPSPSWRRLKRRLRLPLSVVLVVGFGGLLVAAVVSVLFLGLRSAGQNTFTLLSDKADMALAAVEVRVRHQLDPVRDAATEIARQIERGELDPAKPDRLIDTMRGSLAAMPQVTALGFADTGHHGIWAARAAERIQGFVGRRDDTEMRTAIAETERQSGALWTGPIWQPELNATILVLRVPVRKDGAFKGMVAAAVSLSDLSRFLSRLFLDMGVNTFILHDRDHVLAHQSLPHLRLDLANRPDGIPLPRIDELNDPALEALWRNEADEPFEPMARGAQARAAQVGEMRHIFLIGQLGGYGPEDWIVGIDQPMAAVADEIGRLWTTAWVGVGILLVSVGVALMVGRRIDRQVRRLAEAADRISALDFARVPVLPDSRLSELARAAAAFNAMVTGLRWFETFVPKALVLRLMRRDHELAHHMEWEEREVTVMFTDIRGFSSLAEHRSPADTARLLNHHFTLLSECIEAEGGTVDKFIGDAVMAFWGAPDDQPDHAARAARAARAIARVIRDDNRRRLNARLPPVRMGIGIHTGHAVVGNIGSASRINYTMVGDTVNTAARIEELGSSLQGPAESIVLASEATARAAEGAVPMRTIGRFTLRGRNRIIEIHRLEV